MAAIRRWLRRKSDGEDSEDEETKQDEEKQQDEGGYQRRKSIQIVKEKHVLHTFIAKVLLTKIAQQLLTAGYAGFVIFYAEVFRGISIWYIMLPLAILFSIFTWAHFVKSPPNVLICLVLLLTSSLSLGCIIGILFVRFRFYMCYLLSTLSCLVMTNLFLLPFMTIRQIYLNIHQRTYFLLPQLLNLILNIIFISIIVSLINVGAVSIDRHGLNMRTQTDAIFLFVVPTIFWSASLVLLMTVNIKGVVKGNFYFVSRSNDVFLFAALYFF